MAPLAMIVDGTNLVMRAAFGGEVAVDPAVDTAARWIGRAAERLHATHLMVTFDSAAPSWRKLEFPDYKAHRTTHTSTYSLAARERFEAMGWWCVAVDGSEADDICATIATRAPGPVAIYSGDSDLLALLSDRVRVVRPAKAGELEEWDAPRVVSRYGVMPHQLADYKSMAGDPGDGIPGVYGIGPMKASTILRTHGSLSALLACEIPDTSREAARVRNFDRELLLLWRRLATLVTNVPLAPIPGAACRIARHAA